MESTWWSMLYSYSRLHEFLFLKPFHLVETPYPYNKARWLCFSSKEVLTWNLSMRYKTQSRHMFHEPFEILFLLSNSRFHLHLSCPSTFFIDFINLLSKYKSDCHMSFLVIILIKGSPYLSILTLEVWIRILYILWLEFKKEKC